jgi:SAM-dependent methyltransferase
MVFVTQGASSRVCGHEQEKDVAHRSIEHVIMHGMHDACRRRTGCASRVLLLGTLLLMARAPDAFEAATTIPQEQAMFVESDAYERFMGRWSRRLAPLFVTFASVREGDSVLDVGSGTGALAFAILEAAPSARVTGVDPSLAYVRYAQARTPGDRVRFQVGDAQALALPGATFDRTASLLVMNFIPDPAKALREMIRVTRPRGVVAAAVWDYGDGMEMLRVFWDEAVALDGGVAARDERTMPLCRRGELRALWRASGLQRVEEEPIEIELSFTSFDDYWSPFLGGQGPAGAYVRSLPASARAALESRLRARLLGDGGDAPFSLRARAWAVKGVVAER